MLNISEDTKIEKKRVKLNIKAILVLRHLSKDIDNFNCSLEYYNTELDLSLVSDIMGSNFTKCDQNLIIFLYITSEKVLGRLKFPVEDLNTLINLHAPRSPRCMLELVGFNNLLDVKPSLIRQTITSSK